ncbi:hypothetical protein O6H91_11G069300 [Diphasiastrum complanatum]|uniref:Uncharacterized protein n=1 Tax=Diphasiastrum complanatum TaxID=34168 RepID=A0ACC2CAA2_DIPCM|nr:hypothetical protein O6H91_11G069300 [Diphasiastrum complanatum]
MATLSKRGSFRRQGSSGMSWADNWVFTDKGMISIIPSIGDTVEHTTVDPAMQTSRLSCCEIEEEPVIAVPPSEPKLGKSRSLRSSAQHNKSSFRIIRWIKSRFRRRSRNVCSE